MCLLGDWTQSFQCAENIQDTLPQDVCCRYLLGGDWAQSVQCAGKEPGLLFTPLLLDSDGERVSTW